MVELLYQHACYVKISYRFSYTTGIAIHTTWNSDHLTWYSITNSHHFTTTITIAYSRDITIWVDAILRIAFECIAICC